jgi:hypothetical protein
MFVVTEKNFDTLMTPGMRNEYWRRVAWALSNIFGADPDLADEARALLEEAPLGEKILAYHSDPLEVAADLAQSQVTTEHIQRYGDQYPDLIPLEQPVSTLP